MDKRKKQNDPKDLVGGTLNILGLKLDLGELVSSPEKLTDQLEQLRETLKQVGGKETLSDEGWKKGEVTVSGHIRTRGLLGEQEFHVGTLGKPQGNRSPGAKSQKPEVTEPPVDVFDEDEQITIVADVPGINLEDLDIKVEGSTFYLATRETSRRSYRKELPLNTEVDPQSLKATCRNGVLEIRLHKKEKAT